ncbi:hypothetical protein NEI02_01165 [Brachyspira pilosicoli]|uniref:Lipoprotein n=1 Tax=Brachyspira pilosicoli TaxID=52584 RepID=A0AAJ6GHL5_BRAPL|nr:hypothetical protein [Brachyspira pilosicoli]WIH90580.1 hypothetical protein NEI02_01165 [Brachyspira pilosicoli]WIH92871.1 hypothetical protein NEI01_01165 [Brachyspira pilosicoli]WIH95160.1 hypothetical protein NEH99_01160 [Brachyspira pilosicoli]
MKSLILFLSVFFILISSCQQQRPNILDPNNVLDGAFETNYVTNVITNNVVITLDYINSQISTLSFEVPNTPNNVKEVFTDFMYKSIPNPIPSGPLSMSVKSKWRERPIAPISTNDVYTAFKAKFDMFLANIGCELNKDPELYLLDMDKKNRVDDITLGIWFAIDFELKGKDGFDFETEALGQLMTNNKITIMFIGGCQTGQVWKD